MKPHLSVSSLITNYVLTILMVVGILEGTRTTLYGHFRNWGIRRASNQPVVADEY